MSILEKIHEAIETSRNAADFNISEDPGHLWVGGKMPRTALLTWQSVFDEHCSWLTVICKDESQDSIQPKEGKEGEKYRINLSFQSPKDVPYLITPEGWRSFLFNERGLLSVKGVKLAFIKNGFGSRAFSVEPWADAPIDNISLNQNRKGHSGPRRQVRCQSSDLMAPVHIEPWILSGPDPENCQAVTIWQEVAALMIAKSLPNELYKDGDIPKINLTGQPPRKLDLGTFQNNEIPFHALQEAATWVYLEGEDVEVRHTFLSAELARVWNPEASFCAGLYSRLADALDSARLVYKAHLRSGSKDTLKSLADLRKTLAEEVQKLLQQSKDLSTAVWRDVAIAIGVIAIRFSMNSAKNIDISVGFAAIYFLLAVYIGVSYWITITTNNRFLEIIETVRQSWRNKLYAFLDDNDYQSLADKPLNEAVKAYRATQEHTFKVVIVVIYVLIISVAHELKWIEGDQLFILGKDLGVQLWDHAEEIFNLSFLH
jgi:hypothetical protein